MHRLHVVSDPAYKLAKTITGLCHEFILGLSFFATFHERLSLFFQSWLVPKSWTPCRNLTIVTIVNNARAIIKMAIEVKVITFSKGSQRKIKVFMVFSSMRSWCVSWIS